MNPTARLLTDPARLLEAVAAAGERSIDGAAADRFVMSPTSLAIGGYIDGEPTGYLIGYLMTRLDGDKMLMIYDITVAPSRRRRGVAKAMIDAALQQARTAGAAKAWVVTEATNSPAIELYRASGAIRSRDDDLVLWWPLD